MTRDDSRLHQPVDPAHPSEPHADLAVQALIADGWLEECDRPIDAADLANAVSIVREVDAERTAMRLRQILDEGDAAVDAGVPGWAAARELIGKVRALADELGPAHAEVRSAPPLVTEWAWRDTEGNFLKKVDNRAQADTAVQAFGASVEVLTRTYPEGAEPPEWTVVPRPGEREFGPLTDPEEA